MLSWKKVTIYGALAALLAIGFLIKLHPPLYSFLFSVLIFCYLISAAVCLTALSQIEKDFKKPSDS